MKSIKELMGLDEADKMKGEDPCWDTHQMVGMKMKNGRKVPNCVPKAKPKNEEVEIAEAKVGDTVSFHHELKSAPGSKVKKSGTVEKVDGDVVHVKVKDKYGVKRHQIKMGDLVKEETEQIDELNKDTVYSYNKKADADVEKKHKSLGQLMRKGDAAGANKAAHQINRRLAGMDRAEKRLNTEEVEQIDEISAEVKQKYLAAATKKHLQQFLGRAPVRDKQELDKRRAAIQKTSKELTGKTHYQEEVEGVEEGLQNDYVFHRVQSGHWGSTHLDKKVVVKAASKDEAHAKIRQRKDFVKKLRNGDTESWRLAEGYKEPTDLEEAQFWGNKEMAKQANAASGSTTTMRGRDAKGVYTATLVRKKGESEHKEVSRVYDTKEEVEPIDEVSKELANRVSAARRKQADDSSKKDPYLKPSAETVAKKKKADDAHASWIKRMHRDNNRGKTQADISREHAAAADYNSKRGWTNEEIELEEAEEVKKVKMTPQERTYKRKLGLKAVVGTVQEAVKKMRENKKGDPSQTKNVKKGEPLSGKQEPIKVNPELQEK